MVGLTLFADQENLALVYLATIQALCVSIPMQSLLFYPTNIFSFTNLMKYGTKHIIESMEKSGGDGLRVQEILVCGGLGKNRVFMQSQANIVALPVITSTENDPVLIGSAMLAAAASSSKPHPLSLTNAITAMASNSHTIHPLMNLKM